MKEKLISYYGFSNQREFHVFCITACLLLFLTGFLHFFRFGEVPTGFYPDESSIGYNAFCIAETGADEYGSKYPLFFKCFGNYQDPVMVYSIAPMVKMFGLEKWVVRFPSSVFHILASVIFFFLAARHVRNRWICLGGAFVFSILPWVFPISRVMMSGYTAMLLGMMAGWYFLMRALGAGSFYYAFLAGFFWAFAMYAHNIGRPMTALILVCFVLAFNVLLIKRWKVFAVFVISYVISLIPMIVSVMNHPESMTSRFSLLSVWAGSSGPMETMLRIFDRYFEYFSPSFLFISGDPILRHHTGASGELYIFMVPFIIAGIYIIIKNLSRNPYFRFIFMGLIVYPVAAVVTVDHFHSTRALNGSIFWCLTAVIGAAYIWRMQERKIIRLAFFCIIAISSLESALYMKDYFGSYVQKSRADFLSPIVEAFDYSFKNLKPGETLYVSASVIPQRVNTEFKPFWYSHLLFFGKVPPAIYQAKGIPKESICAYQGQPLRKGILVRSNIVSFTDEGGLIHSLLNDELVPGNSTLIRQFPIMVGKEAFLEVYLLK